MSSHDIDTSIFYDPVKTLSHNCFLNMVLSYRGGGKSYGWLKFLINRYLKTGRTFIYLRRTDVELQESKDQIFDDLIANNEFPGAEFNVAGNDLIINEETCGHYLALSTVARSVPYPNVDFIIMEEFMIEQQHKPYLKNEVKRLISFAETVFRHRENCKIVLLGNYSTNHNPYFDYFKIYPKFGSVFTKDRERSILIHMHFDERFVEFKKQTKISRLTEGSAYGDYMLLNKSMDDKSFIEPMRSDAYYWYTINFAKTKIGVWYSDKVDRVYLTYKVDPKCRNVFAFDTESFEPNMTMIKANRNSPYIKRLCYSIEHGIARYENLSIKIAIWELMNYL